jgi:4-carboxymuconolactone decarboxylase
MASGNATLPEMHEFVLQYAIHGGWPKASVMQAAVFEMGDRVAKGLPYQ